MLWVKVLFWLKNPDVLQKNADINKIKKGLVLKGIYFETTYVYVYVLRWDQVNLLVYGPDQPYFKQKKNFGQLAFFNLLFSAFWKKKEIKHNKLI